MGTQRRRFAPAIDCRCQSAQPEANHRGNPSACGRDVDSIGENQESHKIKQSEFAKQSKRDYFVNERLVINIHGKLRPTPEIAATDNIRRSAMTQNPMDGKAKLRLKNTDTNRFKVETGSMPAIKPPAPPPARGAETPEATQTISDPLSLRDTATGKLKRITDTQTSASALAPSQVTPAGDTPQKTETVRLKVVRSSAKPGVSLGPGAPAPILPPTPGINAATLKLGDRAAPLPPALKATGRMQRVQSPDSAAPAAPQAAETAPPTLKVTAPEAPAAPAPAPEAPAAPAPAAATEAPAASAPAAPPKGASPTIKINIMRPSAAAKPASEPAAAPAAPAAAEAPAPPGAPAAAAPSPGTSTLKIRPATPGVAQAPASQSASATVKLTPPPSAGSPQPSSTLKLSLKKDPAPPAAAPEAAPEQAGTTQAVPPPAEAKKGGLKIKTGDAQPLSSAATQALPLPPSTAPAAAEAKAPAPEAAAAPKAAVALTPEPAASKGPGAVEAIAAIAACAALITGAVRIVMDLMQQF